MGVRNRKKDVLDRLQTKTLDARFTEIIRDGLGCSAFESEAILNVVREVYFGFLDPAAPAAPPGKITLVVVSADEPAGKSVAECEKQTVCLSLHRGAEDDELLQKLGTTGFRRARIPDLAQEALSQDGLLTREDLAYRVFLVGVRTISRDLKILREEHPDVPVPMRGTVHDIGPVLTHRTRIVQLALEGRTTSEICSIMHHSPTAVANYVSTFARCAYLARRGMQPGQIAFLVRRGKGLVRQYLDLLDVCRGDRNMTYHLEELMRIEGAAEEQKKGRASRGRR